MDTAPFRWYKLKDLPYYASAKGQNIAFRARGLSFRTASTCGKPSSPASGGWRASAARAAISGERERERGGEGRLK